jgi:hypothetical protein
MSRPKQPNCPDCLKLELVKVKHKNRGYCLDHYKKRCPRVYVRVGRRTGRKYYDCQRCILEGKKVPTLRKGAKWSSLCAEHTREREREQRRLCVSTSLIGSARASAKKRGVPFDLTKDWLAARWTGYCELTGLPFATVSGPARRGGRREGPSIDRVRAEEGYVQSNCRVILQAVNQFRGDGTDEEMLRIARALVRGRKLGGELKQNDIHAAIIRMQERFEEQRSPAVVARHARTLMMARARLKSEELARARLENKEKP